MKLSEFVNSLYPTIVRIAPEYGILCPQAVMAQAIVESWKGSGISYLAKLNNFFGMKCGTSWKGKSVNLKTKEEYTVGILTSIKDNFRVYDDIESGIRGYFIFISTKRYSALKGIKDPRKYFETLKACGYATSSKYVETCMNKLKYVPLNYPIDTGEQIDQIAKEVICGLWGNGDQRRIKLQMSGYDYELVQKRVNELLTTI